MHFETTAVHAGAEVDETTGAVAPPIHLSTTFERGVEGDAPRGYSYVRDGNPTQVRLESALAAIDSAGAAVVFGSGMAAGAAFMQALEPGSHVVLPDDCYYGFRILANDFFPKWNLESTFVSMTEPGAVDAAVRPSTRVIWCETPSNPYLRVVDIAALVEKAHAIGALLAVDGTFATPALQRPIELGADVVLHSMTKYLGGHSDVQGGSLAFRERGALYERVLHAREIVGGVASPFNSWLVLRGIRTLPARMRVHCENARLIARFLDANGEVEVCHYPGLSCHPGHEIAQKQMSDFGGMMSFLVKGGRERALEVASKTRIFTRATSLGGTESLIEHRQSSEGPDSRTAPNLLRLSVGLEHPDDLIADLDQALRVSA